LKSSPSGSRFAFTEGAVMSASDDTVRRHEGVHVMQHDRFGPIHPIARVAWFIAMIIPGLIGAAVDKLDAGEGVTRMSSYDDPWEVMACGIMNPSSRNTSDDLIWDWVGSVIVCVPYVLAATVGCVALLIVRLG
jgi:hypothetical protein